LKGLLSFILITSLVILVAGCGQKKELQPVSSERVESIAAPILNTDGEKIGEVSIVENIEGVTIDVIAENLTPGKKGIHIHEFGKCELSDFKTAGGHLNPFKKEHGFDNPKGYHLGDLPNIDVDHDGTVNVSLQLNKITLDPNAKNTILDKDGSAIIIHSEEDDYKTDPAGNAGERIACAAILN